jgi:hypothetical protein
MTKESLVELKRRLQAEGFEASLDERGAGIVGDGRRNARVMEDGELRFKPESRDFACRVKEIRDEVDEYMAAFKSSEHAGGGLAGNGANAETRALLAHGGCELAMRWHSGSCADFVTWRLDRNGERELGHYHGSYADAKEDFALRAGLVDRSRLFTETELSAIRSSLSESLSFGNWGSEREEGAAWSAIGKIDRVIAPAISVPSSC